MGVALVFGARGFVGRAVVRTLRSRTGWLVVESDLPALSGGPADELVGLDLVGASPATVAATIEAAGASVVVNCAGRTGGTAEQLASANVDAVAHLLSGLAAARGRPRLVHLGSAAEYGPAPEDVPVGEDAPTAPVGDYGRSKLAATRLVCDAVGGGAVEGVVLRVFNVVGAGMPEGTLAGAATSRLRSALEAGAGEVEMGPLGAVRDFVDLRDVAAAVVAACLAPRLAAPVVNIGTGQAHTARDLVEALAAGLGYRGRIVELGSGSARSEGVPWMVADVSLAERVLGWRATLGLDSIAAGVLGPEPGPDGALGR